MNLHELVYVVIFLKVARLQEENRELKGKVKSLAESNGAGIPLDLSREFEQRVKRLEAELEVSEEQRRKAAQEVVKLQSQLSESQHAAMGNKEMLVSEVLDRQFCVLHRPCVMWSSHASLQIIFFCKPVIYQARDKV